MQIGSPAFARGGTIPARYTCDGSDVSPPLRWSNVPKGAAELVLFVLDEDSVGAEGGIRWVLGGIDPGSHGVAAGALPKGAVAGRNTAGQAGWGGICPRSGETHLIMVVLYALKRRIPLGPGFVPADAEQRFPRDAIALAKTFGYYRRRG